MKISPLNVDAIWHTLSAAAKDKYIKDIIPMLDKSQVPSFHGVDMLRRSWMPFDYTTDDTPVRAWIVNNLKKVPDFHIQTKSFTPEDKGMLKDLIHKFPEYFHNPNEAITHVKEYKKLDEMGKAAHDTFIKEWSDTPQALIETARSV